MAPFVFNVAKGKWRYYMELPGLTDSLVWTLFQSTGIQADDVLNNHADLGAIKASNAEANFTSYARIFVTTGIVITQNNTTNVVNADTPDQTFVAATPGNTLAKAFLCYKPDSTALDSAIIPLLAFDCAGPTNGSDIILQVNAGGLIDTA
jgi:hypothetical protein